MLSQRYMLIEMSPAYLTLERIYEIDCDTLVMFQLYESGQPCPDSESREREGPLYGSRGGQLFGTGSGRRHGEDGG